MSFDFTNMDSNSQPASTYDHSHRLADILGTVIAMLTLTLPFFVIGHYSSSNMPSTQAPITYNVQRSGD
jgi:hypothetical protein